MLVVTRDEALSRVPQLIKTKLQYAIDQKKILFAGEFFGVFPELKLNSITNSLRF